METSSEQQVCVLLSSKCADEEVLGPHLLDTQLHTNNQTELTQKTQESVSKSSFFEHSLTGHSLNSSCSSSWTSSPLSTSRASLSTSVLDMHMTHIAHAGYSMSGRTSPSSTTSRCSGDDCSSSTIVAPLIHSSLSGPADSQHLNESYFVPPIQPPELIHSISAPDPHDATSFHSPPSSAVDSPSLIALNLSPPLAPSSLSPIAASSSHTASQPLTAHQLSIPTNYHYTSSAPPLTSTTPSSSDSPSDVSVIPPPHDMNLTLPLPTLVSPSSALAAAASKLPASTLAFRQVKSRTLPIRMSKANFTLSTRLKSYMSQQKIDGNYCVISLRADASHTQAQANTNLQTNSPAHFNSKAIDSIADAHEGDDSSSDSDSSDSESSSSSSSSSPVPPSAPPAQPDLNETLTFVLSRSGGLFGKNPAAGTLPPLTTSTEDGHEQQKQAVKYCVIQDQYISRKHFQIVGDAKGRYFIQDKGSLNGTYIRHSFNTPTPPSFCSAPVNASPSLHPIDSSVALSPSNRVNPFSPTYNSEWSTGSWETASRSSTTDPPSLLSPQSVVSCPSLSRDYYNHSRDASYDPLFSISGSGDEDSNAVSGIQSVNHRHGAPPLTPPSIGYRLCSKASFLLGNEEIVVDIVHDVDTDTQKPDATSDASALNSSPFSSYYVVLCISDKSPLNASAAPTVHTHRVSMAGASIGHTTDCDIVLDDDNIQVSAEVVFEKGKFYIRDKFSPSGKKGLWNRLSNKGEESTLFQIFDGDSVRVGMFEFDVSLHNVPPPLSLSSPQSTYENGSALEGNFVSQKEMQDRLVCIPHFAGHPANLFAAIFDGHQERTVADFAASALHHHLLDALNDAMVRRLKSSKSTPRVAPRDDLSHSMLPLSLSPSNAASSAGAHPDLSREPSVEVAQALASLGTSPFNSPPSALATASPPPLNVDCENHSNESVTSPSRQKVASITDKDIVDCIKLAYRKTASQIKGMGEAAQYGGSTAVTVLLWYDPASGDTKLFASNIGDSRALLIRDHQPLPLSHLHVGRDPSEQQRVRAAGGRIMQNHRLLGCLEVTRAFGDRGMEKYGLIAEPYIMQTTIQPNDTHLIVSSDGLFETLDNKDIVNIIERASDETAQQLAHTLIDTAIKRKTRDNMSVIVCKLRRPRVLSPTVSPPNFTPSKSSSSDTLITSPTQDATQSLHIVVSPTSLSSAFPPLDVLSPAHQSPLSTSSVEQREHSKSYTSLSERADM